MGFDVAFEEDEDECRSKADQSSGANVDRVY